MHGVLGSHMTCALEPGSFSVEAQEVWLWAVSLPRHDGPHIRCWHLCPLLRTSALSWRPTSLRSAAACPFSVTVLFTDRFSFYGPVWLRMCYAAWAGYELMATAP